MRKKILLVIMVTLLLVACSKEATQPTNDPVFEQECANLYLHVSGVPLSPS